jgi:hypothetical protein
MHADYTARETTCHYCKELNVVGSRRLTDNTMVNGRLRRVHYHPECFIAMNEEWYQKGNYTPTSSGGGRPSLGLTTEQRSLRLKLLNRLSYLRRKYGPTAERVAREFQGKYGEAPDKDLFIPAANGEAGLNFLSTLLQIDIAQIKITQKYIREVNSILDVLGREGLGGSPGRYKRVKPEETVTDVGETISTTTPSIDVGVVEWDGNPG